LVMADALTAQGETASAQGIIRQVEGLAGNDGLERVQLLNSEYLLHEKVGDYGKALPAFEQVVDYQDSLLHDMLQQSLVAAQRDLFKRQSALDQHRVQSRNTVIYIGILFSIVTIILSVLTYKNIQKARRKENELHINEMNTAILRLKDMSALL